MMALRAFAFLLLVFLVSSCVTKPTVVRETNARNFTGAQALMGPIVLDETVVIADARTAFDYSMARIPRSIQINWADYAEAEPTMRGWPQKDLFAAARRLARLGITPESRVVVLGYGKDGQGEEGRVAWMLAYLGVKNIRFGRFGSVNARVTTEALPSQIASRSSGAGSLLDDDHTEALTGGRSPTPLEGEIKSAPIWKPEAVGSLIASREEVLGAIENRAVEKPWALTGGKARLYRLIDVRPAKEYLGQRGGLRAKTIPNLDAVNIPWKEFFNEDLRPNAELLERLTAIGIRPEHRILVIDNDGVASAAATMALRALGFNQAANYAGGYNDMLAK